MSEAQAINIIEDAEGELRVSSLIIAGRTEVQHKNVLELVRKNLSQLSAFGGVAFETQPFMTGGGAQMREFALLNEPQSTLLMTFMRNSPVVVGFKVELVKQFYLMRQALAAVPQMSEQEIVHQALQITVRQVKELEAKVAEDAPKVLFADSVAASKSTILVGELAKILRGNGVEIGQNRLFDLLRDEGFLIKRKGSDRNMPTQYSMERELFEIKETAVSNPDGTIRVTKTPKVTGKGQAYFINRYQGFGNGESIADSTRRLEAVDPLIEEFDRGESGR